MPTTVNVKQAFNRGIISPLALGRTDLKRVGLAAEVQTNFMPRVLGAMSLRPGFEYIGGIQDNNPCFIIPFIYSTTDEALIELTPSLMRVWVDDEIVTRESVSTAITNGGFTSDLSGWTDADSPGADSIWTDEGLSLTGAKYTPALRTQEVSVSLGDQGVEHALRIVVTKGPVRIRVGSTAGDDDYISEAVLRTGTFSLTFTPTGNFHIWIFNKDRAERVVRSITIESSGQLTLPTPWVESNFQYLRWDTSADVIFVACYGVKPYRIERYGVRSWAVVEYLPEDGPFRTINTSGKHLYPSALNGNVTITSSFNLFKPTHVGALFKITSYGQGITQDVVLADSWTDSIEVTGVGSARAFSVTIGGTWAGTIELYRSVGEPDNWVPTGTKWTSNTDSDGDLITDGFDNQIIYYRVGFPNADPPTHPGYSSGVAEVALNYPGGGITGIARVTEYTSQTVVQAEVLKDFGGVTPSTLWAEGAWSDFRGWPSAVAFYEGRLFWAGKDKIWGSVSDAFESFDEDIEGDSGPISRSLGSGPVDRINWLLPLQRLVIGTDMAERVARSSSLDEPLTPTNFNLKTPSSRGTSPVQPVMIDLGGIFARKHRLFRLSYQGEYTASDYNGDDLTMLCPEIGDSGIRRLAVQRYPDTRIHCLKGDGTAAILIFDPAEEVQCWINIETDGIIENVAVLPRASDGSPDEDKVYYTVKRTINGQTVRYLEKWAVEEDCIGGDLNKQADSFKTYTGVSTSTMTGLSHLEGEEVVVWADGRDLGVRTVVGGEITLSTSATNIMAGLPYTAQYKSTKLAENMPYGTTLNQKKSINNIGVILRYTHAQGLQYGPDFDTLDDMPLMEDGARVDDDYVWEMYDKPTFEFEGDWDTDSRICLQAAAPRPCTILALTYPLEVSVKV